MVGELIHFSDKNEKSRGDQVNDFDDVLRGPGIIAHGFLRAAGLEHFQHAVGDQESADDVAGGCDDRDGAENRRQPCSCVRPTRMIAPTTAIASSALVSDISGVCSSGETRLITSNPMKAASMKT